MQAHLRAMCVSTIEHAAYKGQDAYGAPTYGVPVTRNVYLQQALRLIRNAQGAEVMSQTQVYFDGTVPVKMQDKLTLPDGTSPPIQQMEVWQETRPNRVHHVKVFL